MRSNSSRKHAGSTDEAGGGGRADAAGADIGAQVAGEYIGALDQMTPGELSRLEGTLGDSIRGEAPPALAELSPVRAFFLSFRSFLLLPIFSSAFVLFFCIPPFLGVAHMLHRVESVGICARACVYGGGGMGGVRQQHVGRWYAGGSPITSCGGKHAYSLLCCRSGPRTAAGTHRRMQPTIAGTAPLTLPSAADGAVRSDLAADVGAGGREAWVRAALSQHLYRY